MTIRLLRARLAAWLWPALEPLVAAVVAELVARAVDDAERRLAQTPPQPAPPARYLGGRR